MSDMFRSTVGRCLRETIIGFHVIRKPGVTSLESVAYLDTTDDNNSISVLQPKMKLL